MKKTITIISILLFSMSVFAQEFKKDQRRYSRVRDAYKNKETVVLEKFKTAGFSSLSQDILIRAFKHERILEVWAKNSKTDSYILVTEYKFFGFSGELGPKRQQGDLQIPEGYYFIDRFNPVSSFHLSLGLNYPNKSDIILKNGNAGGDIFIHGNTCTIGCIPISDKYIEELYVIAVEARNAGQTKVPVYIYPYKLNEHKMSEFSDFKQHFNFWNNLKPGYDYFEKHRKLPKFSINHKGNYKFN